VRRIGSQSGCFPLFTKVILSLFQIYNNLRELAEKSYQRNILVEERFVTGWFVHLYKYQYSTIACFPTAQKGSHGGITLAPTRRYPTYNAVITLGRKIFYRLSL
jgi:hypothetical protein